MNSFNVLAEDCVPLSAMQAGMLSQCQRQPDQSLYIEQMLIKLEGELDVGLWQQAWQQVHEAHPALRTSIHSDGLPEPHQVIWPARQCSLPFEFHHVEALNALSEEECSGVEHLAQQRREAGFDLHRPGLYQVDLIQLATECYVQIITISHLVIDGWSFGVLSSELAQCYLGHLQGLPVTLEPAPGISHWLHWQQQQDIDLCGQFWREALLDASPGQAPASDVSQRQSEELTERLQTLQWSTLQQAQLETGCRRLEITQNSCFQAACALVLARWLQQDDVVLGTTQASRPTAIDQCSRIVGPLLNTLPLRWRFDWEQRADDFIQSYHQQLARTLQKGALPLAEILQQCGWPSDTMPFEVLTVFQNTTSAIPASDASEVDELPLKASLVQAQESVGYPMAIYCVPVSDTDPSGRQGLSLEARFDRSRWSDCLVQGLLESIRHTMLQLISVDLPIAQLGTTPSSKCLGGQPAGSFNGGLMSRLKQLAQQQPDAEALCQQGFPALSYQELWEQVNRLAAQLTIQGAGVGEVVGCHMPASPEAFISLLAVMLNGSCFLALDPAYPQERLKAMAIDSGCRLILSNDVACSAGLSTGCELVHWQTPFDASSAALPEWVTVMADHPAYMIYTSGTTGEPKASVNTHGGLENLANNCQQWLQTLSKPPRIFQFAAMNFDASILELCLMLANGGSLYFSSIDCRQRPDLLCQALAASDAGLVMLPPVLLSQLDSSQLPSLHTVMTGGDRCPVAEARRWSASKRFFNLYGPSETSVLCVANPVHESQRPDSLGQVITGCHSWLMDQCGHPLPPGVAGELWIGGAAVSLGYHNRDALTASQFVSFEGQRFYRSGDRCISDDKGYLRILGRLDRQVKIRGVRVEPADVEQMLRCCNGVTDAVVSVRRGDGLVAGLDACVTLAPGYPLNATALQQQLRHQLPGAAVPGRVLLLEHWPMTTNGKVDRQQLEQQLAAVDLREDDDVGSILFTPLGEAVAEKLSELLQNRVLRLDASFFELGGSSLQVAQFLAWLEDEHALQLPLELFYQLESMQTLVDWMEQYPDFNAEALQALLPVTDLAVEARLEDFVTVTTTDTTVSSGWLLTGATGFVGAHLCKQILQQHTGDVFCLVRSGSTSQGMARVREQLEALQLWQPEYERRIQVLCGDLAAPRLGLSDACWKELPQALCHIVHCGAQVNFSSSYGLMKAANVEATRSLLALAAAAPGCSFDFISTMSVMAALSQPPDSVESAELSPLDNWSALAGGYNQSKWVAEKLCMAARQRGMDVSIYRLASVTGDLQTGICNYQDIIWRMSSACRTLKAWPDVAATADLTPANEVARIVVTLRKQIERECLRPEVLLLTNPNTADWKQLYEVFSADLVGWQPLSAAEWRVRLVSWLQQHPNASLAALLPFVSANSQSIAPPPWRCNITQQYFADHNLSFSAVTPEMLKLYMDAMPDNEAAITRGTL